ncbi:hypothetical protein [Facilibium subflavum]|uniref:hypothetical protein n=1 Tax=Facilibium subflavum TaxID=2219058 RepID=UPI000E6528FF|nr:hypothetical protein [Facilibium subflavum]
MVKKQKVAALLHLADRSDADKARGKLKVFLGFAPGVGKTYMMLNKAKELQKEGYDVVLGLVVSHGRAQTLKAAEGLEQIPLRQVQYKEKTFEEIDINAIVARKPDLVIIDELAHSNLPGARNKKRYLDIIEILDAGIDVYTAINIQHIASLSYEVSQITKATVHEIVPDSFIQSADELVVVDLTAKELINRLKAGKIYQQDMANRALSHYFQYTHLSILRDYTFRLAANHIGEDIRQYKKLYNQREMIITSPCVLVCLSYDESTPKLLRRGKQLSNIANARLLGIFVHKPHRRFSKLQLRQIRRYKNMASTLGYDIEHISGSKLSKTIIQYADSHQVTDIVIGKSKRAKWVDTFFGSVVYDLIRHSAGRQVHVVVTKTHLKASPKQKPFILKAKNHWSNIIKASAISFISGVLIYFLMGALGLPAQSLSLVLVLMLCAYRYGLKASIFASLISFIMYMYMYLTPNFVFTIGTLGSVNQKN